MIWDKEIVLTVKVRFAVIISEQSKVLVCKKKNNVKGASCIIKNVDVEN